MADGYEQIELLDKGNWRSKYMLNKQYYEGYEGEGEVKIWYEDGQDENGIVIWIGFWETILEGCYIPDYQSNGIIECYFNHNGFYDDKWEVESLNVVLEELNLFNEKGVDAVDKKIIDESKKIIKKLCCFIDRAIKNKRTVYIECN